MAAFDEQVAIVTGASGGIGGAIACALTMAGAHVVAIGRDSVKLDALVFRTRAHRGALEVFRADLTVDSDIQRLSDHVAETIHRLDILVHSAGGISHGKLEDEPIETMDALYRANVRGPYLLTKTLLQFLKKPRGQLVFINSSAGLSGRPDAGQYSAMQHAVKALADVFRQELNHEKVRVLSIYPGRTATARTAKLAEREGRVIPPERLLQPDDIASVVTNALALPWTAEVTDLSIRPMEKSY